MFLKFLSRLRFDSMCWCGWFGFWLVVFMVVNIVNVVVVLL